MIAWTSLLGGHLLRNVKVAEAVGALSEAAKLLKKTSGSKLAWIVRAAPAFEKQSKNSGRPAVIAAAICAELLANRKVADELARRKTECSGRQRMLTNVDIETGTVSRRTPIGNIRKPQSSSKQNLTKPNIRISARPAENLTKPDIEIAGLPGRLFDPALTDSGELAPIELPVKTCHPQRTAMPDLCLTKSLVEWRNHRQLATARQEGKTGQSGHPKRGRTAASPRRSSRNANRTIRTPKKLAGGRER